MERLIFKDDDITAKNGLVYGVITKLKDNASSAIIGMSNLLPKKQEAVMPDRAFNSALASLRANTPDAKFEKVRDPHKYDLEDFLGIKNIETEIMD